MFGHGQLTYEENVMENVKLRLDGKKLTIEVDLAAKGKSSASGKSLVIATTKGNVDVPGADGVKLGLNIYRKA